MRSRCGPAATPCSPIYYTITKGHAGSARRGGPLLSPRNGDRVPIDNASPPPGHHLVATAPHPIFPAKGQGLPFCTASRGTSPRLEGSSGRCHLRAHAFLLFFPDSAGEVFYLAPDKT